MKDSINGRLLLRASIVAALAAAPLCAFAADTTNVPAGIDTTEAPRVTQAVDMHAMSPLTGTHLGLLSNFTSTGTVDDSTPMNHLQLVLTPSAERAAALQLLIAQLHDPDSRNFHQWLTPEQYGQFFGVVDSDIAAVTAWLTSQGFTVNGIYPSKSQIDFSGTAGLVKQAFHTQEARFKIKGENHIANTTDISVPAALQPVIAGVMGLNDIRPKSQRMASRVGQFNTKTGKFKLASNASSSNAATSRVTPSAIQFQGGTRGLVPFDLEQIYGVSPIQAKGLDGKGITLAVVEDNDMVAGDWTDFVTTFDLARFGGTFKEFQPQATGFANCTDPDANPSNTDTDDGETLLDAEWSTAMAPGANIEVASCDDSDSTNFFGGVITAATNLINGSTRPNVISASFGFGETFVDTASKTAIDQMWAQADVEGISVFVSSGDSGTNPSFNGLFIYGVGIDASALASSPNVTAVGGNDTADVLEGTTSKFFSATPNSVFGTALGYVPEIPWNQSCGNNVAATANGFSTVLAFCKSLLANDPTGVNTVTSESGSGAPSLVDRKPAWQRIVTGAERDQSRDVPDVSLFAGSFGDATFVVTCTAAYPCTPQGQAPFSGGVELSGGTSLSSPMMAGIQALVDQGLVMRGMQADQGNAAPTLYVLAQQEYGSPDSRPPASLDACNASNGEDAKAANCVFRNITQGSNSALCIQTTNSPVLGTNTTPNCTFFATITDFQFALDGQLFDAGPAQVGLTSINPNLPYSLFTRAYGAQPGWSFTSGLGSVNAQNLLTAWRAFNDGSLGHGHDSFGGF
jgi:subtilase family serine protease